MKKIYYLKSCSTCQKIIAQLHITNDVVLQNIKEEKITEEQLNEMALLAGSYNQLFSKVALKYRAMGLNKLSLTEENYKKYILEEYTFLKRPVVIINNKIFIGSSKSNVSALISEFNP